MCCGQPANRLDDAQCHWLYHRYRRGELKWHLCAEFRVGTPEFQRALCRGEALSRPLDSSIGLTGAESFLQPLPCAPTDPDMEAALARNYNADTPIAP